MVSLNARRSMARSPGEAMNTLMVRLLSALDIPEK